MVLIVHHSTGPASSLARQTALVIFLSRFYINHLGARQTPEVATRVLVVSHSVFPIRSFLHQSAKARGFLQYLKLSKSGTESEEQSSEEVFNFLLLDQTSFAKLGLSKRSEAQRPIGHSRRESSSRGPSTQYQNDIYLFKLDDNAQKLYTPPCKGRQGHTSSCGAMNND